MSKPLHTLLSEASRKPYVETPDLPAGANYSHDIGMWTIGGSPIVNSQELTSKLSTKKADLETGEDQKGE